MNSFAADDFEAADVEAADLLALAQLDDDRAPCPSGLAQSEPGRPYPDNDRSRAACHGSDGAECHARENRTRREHYPHPATPVRRRHHSASAGRGHESPRADAAARRARQIERGDDAAAPVCAWFLPPPVAHATTKRLDGARIWA